MSAEDLKRQAAAKALELVGPGMRLGLGTGSTAAHFVDLLGQRVAAGLKVICVPTSERTRTQAQTLGIPLAEFDDLPGLDLTVDGTDEFDPQLRLIKGGGGALLREKIVAAASRCMVVITDSSKGVPTLGRFPLPVEVNPFGLEATRRLIVREARAGGCEGLLSLRRGSDGQPFVTDGGHYIFDCAFGTIPAPEDLAARLNAIPGVVEHGLFIGYARAVISAAADGVVVYGSLDHG
jgi:ribose 5-phosphate isomerase A